MGAIRLSRGSHRMVRRHVSWRPVLWQVTDVNSGRERASPTARKAAREVGIQLREGETWVRPFARGIAFGHSVAASTGLPRQNSGSPREHKRSPDAIATGDRQGYLR